MIVQAFTLLALLVLLTIQVSFVQSLPFPLDRVPLVLVMVIYLYQYHARTHVWWWLIAYGLLLDVLVVSFAPLEWLSYGLTAMTMVYLASHVFTNRSFYGITATALLCLLVLTVSQMSLNSLFWLWGSSTLPWIEIARTQAWSFLFAAVLLLFLVPWTQRLVRRLR